MKYKPGDRVKIRADLRPGEDYGGLKPVLSMCMKRGNVATIKSSEVYNCMLLYHIEGEGCDFLWTEEMFEKIADKEKGGAEMKYKVGDKVLVKKDLEHNERYSDIRFDKDMEKYRGGQATITKVDKKFQTYEIDLDQGRFMWGDDMFEGLVSGVKKAFSNKTTPARKYKVGDKVKIREDLRWTYNWNGTGINITDDMERKAGKTATIKKALQHHRYSIEEDGGCRTWHDDMFDGKVIPIRVGVSRRKVDIKTEGTSQKEVAEMLGCELKEIPQDDAVSHPSHYTDGKIEVIDFIEDKKLGYHLGNACKYISRCQLKYGGKKRIEDLEKAIWYIKRQIEVWRQDDKQKAEQSR